MGRDWGAKATTDVGQIASWWNNTPHNLGAVVPEGWIVLDPDARNGGPALLAELEHVHVETWTDWNGTDEGRHYWYRLPEGYQGPRPAHLTGRDGAKVDLLWPGHLVIVPPAAHPNGGTRAWLVAPSSPPAEVPAWILDQVSLSAPGSAAAAPGASAGLPPEAAALLAARGAREYDPQAIVSACSGVWHPDGLTASMLCPSHEDANPSASLTIKPGKVLWHCYAGCDQPTLTKAIRAIPGALLPRLVERKAGVVYRHQPQRREPFATYIEALPPTLLAANPPGGDWAAGYGSQYGIEDRPRLWADAVSRCSQSARGARADCAVGAGRVIFGGFVKCKYKFCPVCSGARLMTNAHEHDRAWLAAGVEVFDLWVLTGPATTLANTLKAGNEAMQRWRRAGGPGGGAADASLFRTITLYPDGITGTARARYLLAVPAGRTIEGWPGPAELLRAGVGFDEVHETQIGVWGSMLDQVRDTSSLEDLHTAMRARTRILEPLGLPRTAGRKAKRAEAEVEKAEAEAEGVSVPALRAARRPQGVACPWCRGSHPLSAGLWPHNQGRYEDGVWVLAWPDKPPGESQPPPVLRERQLAVTW